MSLGPDRMRHSTNAKYVHSIKRHLHQDGVNHRQPLAYIRVDLNRVMGHAKYRTRRPWNDAGFVKESSEQPLYGPISSRNRRFQIHCI